VKTACGGILAAALALAATQAPAAGAAMVEGVQMPAWVERGAQRIPLAPGMELKAGDQLNTGAGSRVVVKLSEGSVVKLGENGSLRIAELDPAGEIFKAALDVLEGAFRFTTGILAKGRQREVNLKVATVTAGIRGTDLWGRARTKNEVVCLIEGQAEVGAEGEQAVTLDQPLQFYSRQEGRTSCAAPAIRPRSSRRWTATSARTSCAFARCRRKPKPKRSPSGCAAGSASTIRRFRVEAAYIIAALCRCTSNTSIRNNSPPSRCPMSTR